MDRALEHLKTRPDIDPARLALMGFSRGGLLSLMAGLGRNDLKALLLLAPAPGRGLFEKAARRAGSLNAPVLLLVERGDSDPIRRNVDLLERALEREGKKARVIRYDQGGGHQLFCTVGFYQIMRRNRTKRGRNPCNHMI